MFGTSTSTAFNGPISDVAQLQSALENLGTNVFMVDENLELVYINAKAQETLEAINDLLMELFGFGHDEMLGKWIDVFHKDPSYQRGILRTPKNLPHKAETLLGPLTLDLQVATVFNEGGDYVGTIVNWEVITDRKRAEEERLRLIQVEHERNRLKEAVAAQEQLLGVVGHELRTPLAALRATSEYLLTEDARQTDEWDFFLQSINDETIRMANIVDNLLEAARLNSGTASWTWGTVRLEEVCDTAIDDIRPLVDAAKVHLECCVEPANLTMNGDADAIRRLVLNLVDNSHKHTAEGSIRVMVRRLDEPQEPRIEIEVQDSGEGIARHLADRLGTAFALNTGIAGASYTKGTGLGLAICKGIVAAHGGTLSIQSAQGKGTTVTVRLRTDLAEAVADTADLTIEREIAA